MKHKSKLILILAMTLCLILPSCSSDGNPSSSTNIKENTTKITSSFTQSNSTSDKIQTDSTISTTFSQSENKMTDQEVLDLGEKEGNQLKQLFTDYLKFGDSNLIFTVDPNEVKDDFGIGGNLIQFSRVESSKYKTYSQLYNYFCTFCTSEYSKELLTQTTHIYKDIDGKLYMSIAEGGFMGYSRSKINSFNMTDDTIVYYCTGLGDDSINPDYDENNPVHDPKYDEEYTMTIKKINNKWYIDSCSDFFTLVYTWQ